MIEAFADGVGGPEDEDQARSAFLELGLDLPLRDALSRFNTPTRVATLIADEPFASLNLVEVLVDRRKIDTVLRRWPNVGRKSRVDFWQLALLGFAQRMKDVGVTAVPRSTIVNLLAINPDLLTLEPEVWDDLPFSLSGDTPLGDCDLIHLCEEAVRRLTARDGEILRRRFPARLDDIATLDELGKDYGVSRERIRQIESRGLRLMRTLLPRPRLGALLNRWSRGWSALAGEDDVLLLSGLPLSRRGVDGRILLLFEVAKLDLSAFLDMRAHRYSKGWLAAHADRPLVDDVAAKLGAVFETKHLPRPLSDFGPPRATRAALLLTQGVHVSGGYVFSAKPSPRPRRTATVHALIAPNRRPTSILDLHFTYIRATPQDACSPRDLLIVMQEAQHLFIETAEGEWAALGAGDVKPVWPSGSTPDSRICEADAAPEEPDDQGFDDDGDPTVASALRDALARTGPQSIGQLMSEAPRILPEGRSRHSVGPTLIGRPQDFVRILPGVYALTDQAPFGEALLDRPLPYLLNPAQARLFAQGRRAGEPWGAFPLWVPEAEMRLCQWARSADGDDLYRSLLAIADIDAWPAPPDFRAEWRDLKRRYGRYDLVGAVREDLIHERPPIDRIFAALIDLQAYGHTNWIRLNRILNKRIDSHSGCALLVALSALGAISSQGKADDSAWQLPHSIGDAAEPWRNRLAEAQHAQGALSWSSPIGKTLSSAIVDGRRDIPAWANAELVSRAYSTPQTGDSQGRDPEAALLAERRMQEFLAWVEDT